MGNLRNTDKLKQKDKNFPEFITQKQVFWYFSDLFLHECIDQYRT